MLLIHNGFCQLVFFSKRFINNLPSVVIFQTIVNDSHAKCMHFSFLINVESDSDDAIFSTGNVIEMIKVLYVSLGCMVHDIQQGEQSHG